MENASKALIIAGAILLAILLISLGIMIFNQAQIQDMLSILKRYELLFIAGQLGLDFLSQSLLCLS